MRSTRVRIGLSAGLLLVSSQSCGEPTEPSLPPINASHVCCPVGVGTPFYADGRWTEVSVTPVSKSHPFDFHIIMTHPFEKGFGPNAGGVAGSFPGGTSVQFVVEGCNPEIPNLCFTARQGEPPPPYPTENGVIRVGAELASEFECGECDDFIYDIRMTPVPPPDTIVLEITPARRDVTPITAGCFNANDQTPFRCMYNSNGVLSDSAVAKRTDTVSVKVRVYFSPSGLPAVGASARLIAFFRHTSGGHDHGIFGRPQGRFFLLDQRELVDSPQAGIPNQVVLGIPESGDTTVIFRTSGIGGIELLAGSARLGVQRAEKIDSVLVRIPGLVPLAEGGNIDLVGVDDHHPPSARYHGTPEMVAAVRALADSLRARADSFAKLPPEQRPAGRFPQQLGVNDMSLPWGGLFDLFGTWHHPHKGHRGGRTADIDVQGVATDDRLAEAVYAIWVRKMGHAIFNERQSKNHLHLEY